MERNSDKNLNFREIGIWGGVLPAPLCYSIIRRLTVIAAPTYTAVSISLSCTKTNFNHTQCHKYLAAVYSVTRAVMLRYIDMDNCVLFCMLKRKKPEVMHCLEQESKLDCKFRLRAWYTPTQHRTPDYDTYLVCGRFTALCRINRMYAAVIRDTVMMARKLVLCWAQEIRQFPSYSNPKHLTHHEMLQY